jgi:hypothetical protein
MTGEYKGSYVVIMRKDSCGPIEQLSYEKYDQAKAVYDKVIMEYTFVKLCKIVLDSREIYYET